MTFARMDRGTIEDWATIKQAVGQWQSGMPKRIKALLRQLEEQFHGFEINQLQHGLQTATRALRGGATEELVIAALCHDMGNLISMENHSAIAAEILKPYVSRDVYEIVRTHQDFQRQHYYWLMGKDPTARRQYVNKPWYKIACRFSDEWDQTSFDPLYNAHSLEYFEPMIERVFKQHKREIFVQNTIAVIRRGEKIRRWIKQYIPAV